MYWLTDWRFVNHQGVTGGRDFAFGSGRYASADAKAIMITPWQTERQKPRQAGRRKCGA
jgi:hypothetical protein